MSSKNAGTASRFSLALRVGLVAAAVGTWAVVSACSSSGGKRPADAGNQDGFVIDYHFGELPPGCPPAAGNDKGVGNPCSKSGSKDQCGNGMICACQDYLGVVPPDDTPCFCTIPFCSGGAAGTCGQGATCCSYMNQGSMCVPDACLPQMQCPVF